MVEGDQFTHICYKNLPIYGVSSGVVIFLARCYLTVSSGTITDEMIQAYIDEQEGEQIAIEGLAFGMVKDRVE